MDTSWDVVYTYAAPLAAAFAPSCRSSASEGLYYEQDDYNARCMLLS